MQPSYRARRVSGDVPGSAIVDGLLQDGTDRAASWRAHLRESTMARQAAEQRYAQSRSASRADDPESMIVARECASVLRAESARINATHRAWMSAHGMEVLEPFTRTRKPQGTAQH